MPRILYLKSWFTIVGTFPPQEGEYNLGQDESQQPFSIERLESPIQVKWFRCGAVSLDIIETMDEM
jgi:hypothetical protein